MTLRQVDSGTLRRHVLRMTERHRSKKVLDQIKSVKGAGVVPFTRQCEAERIRGKGLRAAAVNVPRELIGVLEDQAPMAIATTADMEARPIVAVMMVSSSSPIRAFMMISSGSLLVWIA